MHVCAYIHQIVTSITIFSTKERKFYVHSTMLFFIIIVIFAAHGCTLKKSNNVKWNETLLFYFSVLWESFVNIEMNCVLFAQRVFKQPSALLLFIFIIKAPSFVYIRATKSVYKMFMQRS